MSGPLPRPWTVDDFLEWEAQQEERYEFIDGRILGMVGGSIAHATIKGNVYSAVRGRLGRGRCRVLVEGPKVVTATSSYYPDVVVTCTPSAPTDDRVAEPVVVIEVLSRTTEDRDRSMKWTGYREIASLQHYVLIAQDRRQVELYSRSATGWSLEIITDEGRIALPAVAAELSLDEIYEDSGA